MSAGYGPPGGYPPGAGGYGGAPGAPGGYGPPHGGAFAGVARQPGASEGTVGEMFSNFGLLFKRSMSGIAWVYILYAIITFVFGMLPNTIVNTLRVLSLTESDPIVPMGVVLVLGTVTGLLMPIVSIAVGTAQAGLGRAARIALVEGKESAGGVGGAFKASFARYFHVMANILLLALAVVIGLLLCILPGIAVMYLLMAAPFLTAACNEGPWDALMRSGRLTTKYIGPCAVLTGIFVVVGAIAFGINLGVSAAAAAFLGLLWAPVLSGVVGQVIGIPVGLVMWMLAMSTFVTIETAESGVAIKK